MIKHFFLVFENEKFDSLKIKHIQYNIQKRLRSLKYIKYCRIDILLDGGARTEILWEDDRSARLKNGFNEGLVADLSSRESIVEIYKSAMRSLKELWEKNTWETGDLEKIYNEIEEDNYSSYGIYGKTMVSPNKEYKAEFFLEMFSNYTNYFLQFKGKKNMSLRKIFFLKGFTDPFLFFSFFCNAYWRDNESFFLKDLNNEIIYVFNFIEERYLVEFKPVINSLDQLHGYIQAFQFDTPKQKMHELLGIPAP